MTLSEYTHTICLHNGIEEGQEDILNFVYLHPSQEALGAEWDRDMDTLSVIEQATLKLNAKRLVLLYLKEHQPEHFAIGLLSG